MRLFVTIAAVLIFAGGLRAAEHPEHPTEPAKKEHPADHEHPAKKEHPPGHEHPVGSKGWKQEIRKGYTAAVEDHVRAQSKDKPGFPVQDDKLGKRWDLKLLNIHKHKIVHLGGDKFFACADFKTVEKGKKDKVDLDFYATKGPEGWVIDEVVVHKVNGEPRFTYNDKNEKVPAGN